MGKYVIGIDYGTESGRIVLVDVATGDILSTHTTKYPHGVIDEKLPTGEYLKQEWALQHPDDYLLVLGESIPQVIKASGIQAKDIVGVGLDFTSSTILPVDTDGVPLCLKKEYKNRPHSWPKLWKHHASQPEAELINKVAERRSESFLKRYGGKISSEWMVPKILQILHEDPEIYEQADIFLEAGDWIVLKLTNQLGKNAGGAGFKSLWGGEESGFPSPDFFKELHHKLEDVVSTKLRGTIVPSGNRVGGLSPEMSKLTGLAVGTPVGAAIIDAFAAVPAAGASKPGTMVMAMGTSTCHLILSETENEIKGITGVVKDGIIPGFYGYEAGQAAVGDIFAWFIETCVPSYVVDDAKKREISLHQWLEEKASDYKPGETGLLALDWWNGNRSILADYSLSGMIMGLTLSTKPEEIYRALIEATAFGTRRIVDQFQQGGIKISHIYALGGLAKKNKMLMQIYADVLGVEIHVPIIDEGTALGAAMLGTVAAGKEGGGYDSLEEAIQNMSCKTKDLYAPKPENVEKYQVIYDMYCRLHDFFGSGENKSIMHKLRDMR